MSSLEQIATDHETQKEEKRKADCENVVNAVLEKMYKIITPQIKEEFNFGTNYKVSKERSESIHVSVEVIGHIIVSDVNVEVALIRKYDWNEKFFFQARVNNLSLLSGYEFTLNEFGKPIFGNDINIEIEAGRFLQNLKANIQNQQKFFKEKYDSSLEGYESFVIRRLMKDIEVSPYISEAERSSLLSKYEEQASAKEVKEKEDAERNADNIKRINDIVKEGQRLESLHVEKLTQMVIELRKKYSKPFVLFKTCFYPEGLNFVDLRIKPENEDDEYEYESLKEYIYSGVEPVKGEYVKAVRGGSQYEVKITGHISYIEKVMIDPIAQTAYAKYIHVAPLQFKHYSFALYVNPYEADRILAEINELKVEHFNFEAYLESHGVKRGVSGGYCFA